MLLLLLAQAASAEPRLFLPVFINPAPATFERDLRILSATSGESLGAMLTRRSVTATAMDAGGRRLFIGLGQDNGTLAVYSVATGRLRTIDIPVVFPNALALDEAGGRLFVGSRFDDRIAEIDLASLQITKLIETGGVSGIAVDPKRDRLHLIRFNALETIDPETSTVIQRIDLPPASASRDVQRFDALRDRLYLARNQSRLEVFDVTANGLVPYATVEFDSGLGSLYLDAEAAQLYAATTPSTIDAGNYAIDVDSIPAGVSSADAIGVRFLALPRSAPYMDRDRNSGMLYLVQDFNVTPQLPPQPPGDPMSIFVVDPASFEVQQTIDTPIGGHNIPIDGFFSRIDGPNGISVATVPVMTIPGLLLLLALMGSIGLAAIRLRH